MMTKSLDEFKGIQFQMILKHFDHKDELTFRLAGADVVKIESSKQKVLDAFISEKSGYLDLLKKNLIHPLRIEVVAQDKLEANARTGKLKRIIDLRG
jgi:phenylacetate-CoA ligase